MKTSLVAGGVAGLCIALQGCATTAPPLRFLSVPLAHVVERDEAIDPAAAYLVMVPHLRSRSATQWAFTREINVNVLTEHEFLAWLTTAPAFGVQPVSVAVDVATDRPTVVRVPAGRYYISKVFVQGHYYDIDADYSLFEARPGRLSYPGDWTVESGFHESTRGAMNIGWYFDATLVESGTSDMATLVADASGSLARLPLVYARQPSMRMAPGDR